MSWPGAGQAAGLAKGRERLEAPPARGPGVLAPLLEGAPFLQDRYLSFHYPHSTFHP